MQQATNNKSAIQAKAVDMAVLEACLAGDEKAWRQILVEYGPLLRKAVRWTLRRGAEKIAASTLEADTDDVFQEVCFRLVRGEYRLLKTYDPGRASFATWLCVVARSAALDHLRNRKHAEQASTQEIEELVASHEEEGGMLSLPRDVLSARQAYLLHLAFEKDASTTEIAQLMDVHPQTVRSMRNSALARLRWHYSGKSSPKNGYALASTNNGKMQRNVKIA